MKVLHINCNYLGSALHQNMVEHLNVESSVFVPVFRGSKGKVKPNHNVIVSPCFYKIDRLFFRFKQSKILRSVICNYNITNYELVHAYTLFTDGNVAYNLHKRYGIPYVVAIRNTDVNLFFEKMIHLRSLGIKILQNAEAVLFLSETYKNQVYERYIPTEQVDKLISKTFVIPNGIDDFWFDHKCTEKKDELWEPFRLLYVGRIDRNKNISITQKAIDILNNEGIKCKLSVVGSIVDKEVYKNIKDDINTIFYPATNKENLLSYYRENSIFIMPSFHETFGLVYAEALSQGLPVIYSKGQGFDGQFEDGLIGCSVDPNDAGDVAKCIKLIIKNYQELSQNSIRMVEKFRWDKICQDYRKIYSLISARRGLSENI